MQKHALAFRNALGLSLFESYQVGDGISDEKEPVNVWGLEGCTTCFHCTLM